MTGPIGKTAEQGAARRRTRSAAYRKAHVDDASAAAIAKQVIHLRTELKLTQHELATRVGTSYTAISRLESGRHRVNFGTFQRVLTALGVTPVIGYRSPATRGQSERTELIEV